MEKGDGYEIEAGSGYCFGFRLESWGRADSTE